MPNKHITKITIPKEKPNTNLGLKIKAGIKEDRISELRERMLAYRDEHPELDGTTIFNHFYQDIYNTLEIEVEEAIRRNWHGTPIVNLEDVVPEEWREDVQPEQYRELSFVDPNIYRPVDDNTIIVICKPDGLYVVEDNATITEQRVLVHERPDTNGIFEPWHYYAFQREDVVFI